MAPLTRADYFAPMIEPAREAPSSGRSKGRFLASSTRIHMILAAHAPHITSQNATALEIGCGNGQIAMALKERFGLKMECADITNLLQHDLPFHLITNERLEFAKDKQYDYAFLNDVLHHIPSAAQLSVVKEAVRVSKTLLIFETRPTIRAKVLDVVMNYLVYKGKEVVTLTHRDPENWRALISGAGLSCTVKVLPQPLFYYPLHHLSAVVTS